MRQGAQLNLINFIATDLSHDTAKALGMIRAAGPSPYNKGGIDDDKSSGSSTTDKVHWKFDPYEFDSDGRPTDYEV